MGVPWSKQKRRRKCRSDLFHKDLRLEPGWPGESRFASANLSRKEGAAIALPRLDAIIETSERFSLSFKSDDFASTTPRDPTARTPRGSMSSVAEIEGFPPDYPTARTPRGSMSSVAEIEGFPPSSPPEPSFLPIVEDPTQDSDLVNPPNNQGEHYAPEQPQEIKPRSHKHKWISNFIVPCL